MPYFHSRSVALQVDSIQIGLHTAMVMTIEVDNTRVHTASPLSLPPTPLGVNEALVDRTPIDEQTIVASTVPHPIITIDESNDIILESGPDVIVLDDDPIVIILDHSDDDDDDHLPFDDPYLSDTSGDTSGIEYLPDWTDMATDDEDI
jgi:hypothetical protein